MISNDCPPLNLLNVYTPLVRCTGICWLPNFFFSFLFTFLYNYICIYFCVYSFEFSMVFLLRFSNITIYRCNYFLFLEFICRNEMRNFWIFFFFFNFGFNLSYFIITIPPLFILDPFDIIFTYYTSL